MKSIEEKAKSYDEAIKRAKGVIEQNPLMEYLKKGIEYILPELKESDDERIGKEIVNFINHRKAMGSITPEESKRAGSWIAWLEKQCEQKPNPCENCSIATNNCQKFPCAIRDGEQKPDWWNDKDEEIRKELIGMIKEDWPGRTDVIAWLKFIKDKVQPQPKQEWSEEDEEIYNLLYEEYKNLAYHSHSRNQERDIPGEVLGWLKSLKDRYTWKPSDEQMDALHDAAVYVNKSMFPYPKGILMKLYEQLKKLKEK